jgi:quercetin dioxygenase-like cupin family protein
MAAERPVVVDLVQAARERGAEGGIAWSAVSEDLNLNVVVLGPGSAIPEHVNAQLDVVLVGVEGVGWVEIDGHRYRLGTGQAMVIPKGAKRVVAAEGERFAYLSCHRRRPGLMPEPPGS